MKTLFYAFGIAAVCLNPVYAGDLCREEAKAVGYVAALDMLEPCQPKSAVTAQSDEQQAQQKEMKMKIDSQSVAHVDRNLKR